MNSKPPDKATMADLEGAEDFDALESTFPDFEAMENTTVAELAASPKWKTVADFTAAASKAGVNASLRKPSSPKES